MHYYRTPMPYHDRCRKQRLECMHELEIKDVRSGTGFLINVFQTFYSRAFLLMQPLFLMHIIILERVVQVKTLEITSS